MDRDGGLSTSAIHQRVFSRARRDPPPFKGPGIWFRNLMQFKNIMAQWLQGEGQFARAREGVKRETLDPGLYNGFVKSRA